MIRRPPRSTQSRSSAASDVYKRQVLDNKGHPLQLWGWGQLKASHGWSVDRVLGYEGDEVVAGAQVLTRKLPIPFKAISYVPRGPVGQQWGSDDFLNKLSVYIKDEHCL